MKLPVFHFGHFPKWQDSVLRTHPGLLEYCYATPDVGCPCGGEVFLEMRKRFPFSQMFGTSKIGDAPRR